jgi:hypothetical protein
MAYLDFALKSLVKPKLLRHLGERILQNCNLNSVPKGALG